MGNLIFGNNKPIQTPFWSGRSSVLRWYIDGEQNVLHVVSWTVRQVATEGLDHVNGEARARPWKVVDGYEIKVECRQRDVQVAKRLVEMPLPMNEDDSEYSPVDETQHDVAIVVKTLDGSSHGFMTVGSVVVGGWEFGVGGQTDRNTMSLTFHAQDVVYIAA